MLLFVLFALSGSILVTLTIAKRIEEKKKKEVFFLKLISRGDERSRELHHQALHSYSQGKEKIYYWIIKQLPLRARSFWNRFQATVKEWSERYTGDIRDSRLLKKPEGISEFFKNMSSVEKGNGEINDVYFSGPEMLVPKPVRKKVRQRRK